MDEVVKHKIKIHLSYNPLSGEFWWKLPRQRRVLTRPAGSPNREGYLFVYLDSTQYSLHRLAFLLMGEEIPPQVDHINGVKNDNRWCNLRISCASTNQHNRGRYSNNKSGYKGVSWDKDSKKWRPQIKVKGKNIYLGRYDCKEKAYEVYCKAADKYHGEFANHGKTE